MKNFCVFLVSALFLLPTVQAVETDYRQGLSIWFDTPNSLAGQAVWLRSNGNRGANLDREWESRSLPIGNGSLGANILGSVAAERITLNEKRSGEADLIRPVVPTIIGTLTNNPPLF